MHIQVFTLLLLVTCAFGDIVPIEKETNKWGTVTSFCTYKDIKFLPGSSWNSTDCDRCSCSEEGLECEGFDEATLEAGVPDGCKAVNDACEVRMVDAEDELKDCATPELHTDQE